MVPAIVWMFSGVFSLMKDGVYSYTFLIPFPFKIHTITLIVGTSFI